MVVEAVDLSEIPKEQFVNKEERVENQLGGILKSCRYFH